MPRQIRIDWTGSKNPTKAQLRAIQNAARRGDIKNGDSMGPARAVRTSQAREAYRGFHWGRRPNRSRTVRLPSFEQGLYELGKLRAVEYETIKGDERAIWVHKFSKPFPILTGTPSGKLGPIIGGQAFITTRGIEK